MFFFATLDSLVKAVLAVWRACSPVLQPRSNDGFIELGDLPLQHGPQVLSQAVVVLLQLLLVLFLVRCDQVLILLDCLTTPAGQKHNVIASILNEIKKDS